MWDIIVNFFNIILETVKRDNDIHSGKNVILLSQTYFIKENGKQKYIQILIKDNKIFKDIKFWEDFLDSEINREIKRLANIEKNNLSEEMNIEGIKQMSEEKYGNLAFGQIATISDNMLSFGLNKEQIYKIIEPKIKYFQLKQEYIDIIKNLIEKKDNE